MYDKQLIEELTLKVNFISRKTKYIITIEYSYKEESFLIENHLIFYNNLN